MELRNLILEDSINYRDFSKSVRRSSDDKRTVAMISTGREDRHGTMLNPLGCDIRNYSENPVFLFNHDYGCILGNGAQITKDEKGVKALIDDEVWDLKNEEAAERFRQVKDGIIKMTSIGFIPKRGKINWDYKYTDEQGVERSTVYIDEYDLLEFSFVTVGSNPGALVTERNVKQFAELQSKIDQFLNRTVVTKEEIDELLNKRFAQLLRDVSTVMVATSPEKEGEVRKTKQETTDQIIQKVSDDILKVLGRK